MYRRVLGSIALLLLALFLVDSVDAQRRRRRRRPPPPPTEQVEEPAEATAGDPPADQAERGEPSARGAAPGQAVQPRPAGEAADAEGGGAVEERADAPMGPDLAPLRAEHTAVMDELVNVRSRMAVLGRQLFRTKVRVSVHNRAGGGNTLARVVVSLDGAPVHRGDGSQLGEDVQKVFEGFAAPGPHVLGIEVEQRQRANDAYRYTIRDSFRFTVERERLTDLTVVLDDDSDMGEDFEDDGEAEYDVRTRVRVETRELRD